MKIVTKKVISFFSESKKKIVIKQVFKQIQQATSNLHTYYDNKSWFGRFYLLLIVYSFL